MLIVSLVPKSGQMLVSIQTIVVYYFGCLEPIKSRCNIFQCELRENFCVGFSRTSRVVRS